MDTKLYLLYPCVHSFAKHKDISVQKALEYLSVDFHDMSSLPMSSIVVQQCQELVINLDATEDIDEWKFVWNGTKYSTKRTFIELIGNPPPAYAPFKWIWQSCCLSKQKFIFWLLNTEQAQH